MKILLALLACAGLCSCELSPGSTADSLDADRYVGPQTRGMDSSPLGDPRTYMDHDDPNLQKLIATRMFR